MLPERGFESGTDTAALIVASDENEWYTPDKFVDAAREVMGSIDLDPARKARANETTKAAAIHATRPRSLIINGSKSVNSIASM